MVEEANVSMDTSEEDLVDIPKIKLLSTELGTIVITVFSNERPTYTFKGNITGHFINLAEHGLKKAYKNWQMDNSKKG